MSGGTGRHDSDPIKLLKIYEIYAEWLEALYPEEERPDKMKTSLEKIHSLVAVTHENLENELTRSVELGEITEDIRSKILTEHFRAREYQDSISNKTKHLWPRIVYGPVTLASDHYHTVLIILHPDTTPEQEQYVSKRFFNLMKFSWTRHDDILEPEWIENYLEPMAQELKAKGLTRIQ